MSAVLPGARAQTLTLDAPTPYPVGVQPQSLAPGDFNRDGALDLAVANFGSDTVSILLGNGDGTLQAPVEYAVGDGPAAVAATDLDGDGALDLVTANLVTYNVATPSTTSVLIGNGNGTFQPAQHHAAGDNPNSLAAGDFDEDGHMDVALANFGAALPTAVTISVLSGNGDGTLQAPASAVAGRGPIWIAASEFDGDGHQDLVVANFGGVDTLSILLGNGNGTFQPPRHLAATGPSAVVVADLNADAIQDLAVADYYAARISILMGTGGGFFAAAQTYAVGPSPVSLTATDFDGDGHRDLAVANWDGNAGRTFSILRGLGDGTFAPSQDFIASQGVVSIAAGDFDNDGAQDVAVASFAAGMVSVVLNTTPQESPSLTAAKAGAGHGTVTSSPPGISCGADCSESYDSGTVVSLTASPAGGSTFDGWSGACFGTGPCSVTLNAAASVTATFNLQQPPTFALTVSENGPGSGTVTSSPTGINCGADCSESYDDGTVVSLTATPAGGSTFAGWSGACSGTGACSVSMAAARSVTAAFVTAALSGPVLKWQYGGCTAGPSCQTGWYSSPALADLDADGRTDVVWGAYDVVALNGSTGGLKWRAPSGNRVWPGVAVADLTGDGALEVVVARSGDQLTAYDRLGAVLWTRSPFGSGELRSLAVEDLESDGQREIIVGHAGGGAFQVNVLTPGGAARSGWPARHVGEPGWGAGLFNQNLAVADTNGDGLKEVFAPTSGHYITALDRDGDQLAVDSMYAPRAVWSETGIHVDHAVDLRGFADCGVEHRPNFQDSPPVVADVDGDGVREIVVVGNVHDCNTNQSLYHLPYVLRHDRTRWSGSGFDWTVTPAPEPGSAPRSEDWSVIEAAAPNPVVADLDGDGRKEILFPSYDGRLHAFWLDKTEHGAWPYVVPSSGAGTDTFRFASEPVVADLDDDGLAEVLLTSWPRKGTGRVGQLIVLSHLGQERFRVDLPAPTGGASWNGGLGAPALGNIDSDPDLEIVVGTASSGVVAYDLPNTGSARVVWDTGRGGMGRTGARPE